MARLAIVFLSLLVLFCAFVPVAAQALSAPQASDVYTVQSGDTLWELAGTQLDDPRQWRVVVEANPFLKEPGRIFERGGKIIALIRPGEKLAGLEALGILPKVYPLPEFRGEAMTGEATSGMQSHPLWVWFLLVGGAMAAAVIAFGLNWIVNAIARYRSRRANPITAGPAFVAPGVPRTPELVRGRFDRMAEAEAGRRDPTGVSAVRPERIGPIESGFLTGRGRISYADGSSRDLALNRERAYRARFRMPDGSEEVLYSLAGCMNPVSLFQGDRTFAWTTQEIAVPSLRPVPAPTEPAAPAPLRIVSEAPGPTVVTVSDLEFAVPHGSTVSVDAQSRVSIVPTAGTILVSRKAKAKRAKPKVVRPAAVAGGQQSS